MFRVKLRAYPPTHRLRTTRRHSSNSISIIQQARITAEAAAVKVKRAIDPAVTLTATSTQAGASKVPQDLWASRVQAKSVCLFVCLSVWLTDDKIMDERLCMCGIVD